MAAQKRASRRRCPRCIKEAIGEKSDVTTTLTPIKGRFLGIQNDIFGSGG
jgi:hypothetical protein